jgi:hypothetical protein
VLIEVFERAAGLACAGTRLKHLAALATLTTRNRLVAA